jgi:hypothetical protein
MFKTINLSKYKYFKQIKRDVSSSSLRPNSIKSCDTNIYSIKQSPINCNDCKSFLSLNGICSKFNYMKDSLLIHEFAVDCRND